MIVERDLTAATAHGGAGCVDVRRATVRRRDGRLNLELAPAHPCGGAGAVAVDLDLEDAERLRDVLDEGIAGRPGPRLRCLFCRQDVPVPPRAAALEGEVLELVLRCDRLSGDHILTLPVSYHDGGSLALLSPWASTPFTVRGVEVASLEGFFRGLYFPEGSEERARCFGNSEEYLEQVLADCRQRRKKPLELPVLEGRELVESGAWFRELVEEAVWAKFSEHPEAREALLATAGCHLTFEDSVLDEATLQDAHLALRASLLAR